MGMRKTIKYLLLFLVILVSSCNTDSSVSDEIQFPSDTGNYIMFSSDVETRATLINSMTGKNFHVIGFQYDNTTDWETAKANISPNLFKNTLVTYDGGIWEYEGDRKQWDFHSKYSFFAYYPQVGNEIAISNMDAAGMPTITYELPLTPVAPATTVDPSIFQDLMTASAIDKEASGSSIVKFVFQHRLFCIDVAIQNYDNTEYTISDVSLTLDNIKYNKITVPMQKNDNQTPVVKNERAGAVTFAFDDTTIGAKGSAVLTGDDNNILLIPQDCTEEDEALTGSLNLKINGETTGVGFSSNIDFIEGYKYTLKVSIIGGELSSAIGDARTWNIPVIINFEFE